MGRVKPMGTIKGASSMSDFIATILAIPFLIIGVIIALWPVWVTLAAFKLLGWF